MIKVTSANNRDCFYINHRKIKRINIVNSYTHIILDDEDKFIVTDSIEDIQNRIIEFENSIIYFNKINK